jgi:hypothetical protein
VRPNSDHVYVINGTEGGSNTRTGTERERAISLQRTERQTHTGTQADRQTHTGTQTDPTQAHTCTHTHTHTHARAGHAEAARVPSLFPHAEAQGSCARRRPLGSTRHGRRRARAPRAHSRVAHAASASGQRGAKRAAASAHPLGLCQRPRLPQRWARLPGWQGRRALTRGRRRRGGWLTWCAKCERARARGQRGGHGRVSRPAGQRASGRWGGTGVGGHAVEVGS